MAGETHFITLELRHEHQTYCIDHADLLIAAVNECRHRNLFFLHALCILPNHVHLAVTLPYNAGEVSLVSRQLCVLFEEALALRARVRSRLQVDKLTIWKRDIKCHRIRSRRELSEIRYRIYQDPVRHRLVANAEEWLYSSLRGNQVSNRAAAKLAVVRPARGAGAQAI